MHVCMDYVKRCSMIAIGISKCEKINKYTTISKDSLDGTSDKSVDMCICMNSDKCDGVSIGIYSCLEFGMNGKLWNGVKTCSSCDESCRNTIWDLHRRQIREMHQDLEGDYCWHLG